MNKQYEHNLLKVCLNRIPEHYTLYLLPDAKRGGQRYACISMTMESGGAYVFEFDFFVEPIPVGRIDNLADCGCSTCCYEHLKKEPLDNQRGCCPGPTFPDGNGCEYWAFSENALKNAEVEYYKQLHEKCYGKNAVITSHN